MMRSALTLVIAAAALTGFQARAQSMEGSNGFASRAPTSASIGDAGSPRWSGDALACVRHLGGAESFFAIPAGILKSVSVVESGINGIPWPWTLNIAGKPYRFSTAANALSGMAKARETLRGGIDVGCMQVNTRWHSVAFANPAQMLDPRTNVWYAARYLTELRAKYGSWVAAVARYHSPNRAYQVEYLCDVVKTRIWLGYQSRSAWYARTCPAGKRGLG